MRAAFAARITIVAIAVGALIGCGATPPRVMASPALADNEELDLDDDGREDPTHAHDPRDVAQPDPGRHEAEDDVDDRWGEPRSGPRVAEVVAAAYAAAALGGRVPGHLAARARLGGLVPWVSVRTGRDASWHDEDPDVGRGTTLEVRATWRLDRLVFDGRELQVVALEAARRRERRRLATHVIRTYFAWKRAGSRSRAEEAAAELDALTSGWFSETVQRTASEVRTVESAAATP